MEIKNRVLYHTTKMMDEVTNFCFTAVDPFNDETVVYHLYRCYIYHHAPLPFESCEWANTS